MRDSDVPLLSWFPDEVLESDLENMPVHVLVAEDDDATRTLIARFLQKSGYRVSTASDGAAAWEKLCDEEDAPELAILDWMMPGVDGIELCRRLKARRRPFVFVIMLTARCSDQDVIEGLEAGAHEFLSKPFNIHVLSARVAAGARIVRLEKKLLIKSEVLRDVLERVE